MDFKFLLFTFMALALAAEALAADASTKDQAENSTESPIADLEISDSEIKNATERSTTVAPPVQKVTTVIKNEPQRNVKPQTVADFVIHPLIAFKPRYPADELAGRQAGDSSSTTPSPWTLFGFNAGQGLGSSVSSLAGSVSGWLTDRIQLPGLVDSPVRESTTTSTSTTTTTTPRPDVIVRVQHKPSTLRPLISITNKNRPQRFHNNNNLNSGFDEDDDEDVDDQFEDEEEEELFEVNKRRKNKNKQPQPNQEEEDVYDEEEEDEPPVRPVQQKRPQQQRRRRPVIVEEFSEEEGDYDDEPQSSEHENEDEENFDAEEGDENEEEEEGAPQRPNTRRGPAKNNYNQQRRKPQRSGIVYRISKPAESEEVDEDVADEHFYYGNQNGRPFTKRSQQEATFFQRSQENIINQLRQLTRGRTPAEVGALVRKSPKKAKGSKQKKRQQTTLLVNRNGQTIYLAPELLNVDLPLFNPQVQHLKQDATKYPQPPLTVPLKRKNAPTQYVTIPWSQLGIAPPGNLHAVADSIQTQPLILNIPANAIQAMQNQSVKRKKQPVLTPEAVPLLAEAAIIDVFKPPKMPNDRDSGDSSPQKPNNDDMPVIIASKKKPTPSSSAVSTVMFSQRIRPGTFVEKSPASIENKQESSEEVSASETVRNVENKYILVGEDNEPGLTRQVKPVHGDSRHMYGTNESPYLEFLTNGRLALHRRGRKVEEPAAGETAYNQTQQEIGEQLVPVQVISEPVPIAQQEEVIPLVTAQVQDEVQVAQSEPQLEVQQEALEGANVPINVPVKENKGSEPMVAA